MPVSERTIGAYCNQSQLVSYKQLSKGLDLKRLRKTSSMLSGAFQTPMRSRGMEFEEVRQYQAGDDVRSIDWRVTARTGRTHTKQFREEKEKPVFIIVDQRQSMFFGSKVTMKACQAADFATYLAWSAHQAGDKVGGIIFGDQKQSDIRPKSQRQNILTFIHELTDINNALNREPIEKILSLNEILIEANRLAITGAQIFLISDFHDINESSLPLLSNLSRHGDIIAIQTYDTLERQMPATGQFHIDTGRGNFRFKASTRNNEAFAQSAQENAAFIQEKFNALKIPFITASTEDAPLPVLKMYFGGKR